eukprot:6497339-Alexandrium_andersonii.AAC.1
MQPRHLGARAPAQQKSPASARKAGPVMFGRQRGVSRHAPLQHVPCTLGSVVRRRRRDRHNGPLWSVRAEVGAWAGLGVQRRRSVGKALSLLVSNL